MSGLCQLCKDIFLNLSREVKYRPHTLILKSYGCIFIAKIQTQLLQIYKFQFLMIIDCILEYGIQPMQSLGAKTRFGTCRDFETFNRFELMILSSIYTIW